MQLRLLSSGWWKTAHLVPSELGVPAIDVVKVLLLQHFGRVAAEGAACDVDTLKNEGAGDALEHQRQA